MKASTIYLVLSALMLVAAIGDSKLGACGLLCIALSRIESLHEKDKP